MIQVKNVVGTSSHKAEQGSWKKYWEAQSQKQFPQFCSVVGCHNPAEDGCHVQLHNKSDQQVYIAPMCKAHNHTEGVINIANQEDLVLIEQVLGLASVDNTLVRISRYGLADADITPSRSDSSKLGLSSIVK